MKLYHPLHEITDEAKLETLTAAMTSAGWVGAPLVAFGDDLITGTHRYAAALAADIEIPVIQLADLFAAAGLDLGQTCEEEDAFDTRDGNFKFVANTLPSDLLEEYGIEID